MRRLIHSTLERVEGDARELVEARTFGSRVVDVRYRRA
jgi:hypothetical protein